MVMNTQCGPGGGEGREGGGGGEGWSRDQTGEQGRKAGRKDSGERIVGSCVVRPRSSGSVLKRALG